MKSVSMAQAVFYQFKTLTQALERDQIVQMFGHLADATSNYIIENLGLERVDFVTEIVDNAILDSTMFNDMLDKLGIEVE
jgi:uncharacterized membrane protein